MAKVKLTIDEKEYTDLLVINGTTYENKRKEKR